MDGAPPCAPRACAAPAQHRRGEWRRVYHPPAHCMDASPKVLGTAGVQVRKPQKTGLRVPPCRVRVACSEIVAGKIVGHDLPLYQHVFAGVKTMYSFRAHIMATTRLCRIVLSR